MPNPSLIAVILVAAFTVGAGTASDTLAATWGVGAATGERAALSIQMRPTSDLAYHVTSHLSDQRVTVTGDVPGHLGQGLVDRWAQYLAFLGSFLFIAVMWLNHHAAFQRLKSAPTTFLWANFGVLLGAVLLPFPTRLLAGAFEHGNPGDEQVASPRETPAASLTVFVLWWGELSVWGGEGGGG